MSRLRRASLGLLVSLLVTVLVAPTGAVAQEEGPVYVVQEGDTLIGIALRFGADVGELATVNGLADPSSIFPGMRLRLPGYPGVSGVLTTRPVEAGETLASIALRQGSPAEALARLNRLVSPDRLYIGLALIVPVPEGERARPGVRLTLPQTDGRGPLAQAVEAGTGPWVVAGLNRAAARLWLTPWEPTVLPGEDTLPDALPDEVGTLTVEPARPGQGRTVLLRARSPGGPAPQGALGDRTLNFVADGEVSGGFVALQGIHALAEPGLVDLDLRFEGSGDAPAFEFAQRLRIEAETYGREHLVVPAETIDPANTEPEDARIAAVVAPASPERLWSGPFLFPSATYDTFPSFFGTRRNYNGTGWKYYHTGLDLFGSSKTEIVAPAPGVVVFAEFLVVRGNTTYLDHGWGVYTGYLHQSEILVAVGDRVETGQRIGMVGGTGRVTGAHLHWEIWVGGVPVQPLDWTSAAWP